MHACPSPHPTPAELVLKLVQLLPALAQLQLQAVLPDLQLALQSLSAPGGRGQAPSELLIFLLQKPGRMRGQGQRGIRGGRAMLESQAGFRKEIGVTGGQAAAGRALPKTQPESGEAYPIGLLVLRTRLGQRVGEAEGMEGDSRAPSLEKTELQGPQLPSVSGYNPSQPAPSSSFSTAQSSCSIIQLLETQPRRALLSRGLTELTERAASRQLAPEGRELGKNSGKSRPLRAIHLPDARFS